jgi:argininosuccinate lyase
LTVHPARCRNAIHPAVLATDLADYLVGKGVPFRSAHEAVGKAVRLAEERNETLHTLPLSEYHGINPAFESDLFNALSLEASISRRAVYGGTAPDAVKKQVEVAKNAME